MLQAAALAALALSGLVQVWHILALALFYGAVMGFDTPVRQSLLVALVGDRTDLANAIALNSLLMNSSRLIGPSIAGLLLAVVSEGTCFLINALSYVAIIAAALALRVPHAPVPAVQVGLRHGLIEGARYAWSSVPIRMLLPMVALVSFTASPYVTLMPVVARDVLGGGAHYARIPGGRRRVRRPGAGHPGWQLAARFAAWAASSRSPQERQGLGLTLVSFSRALWISLPLMVGVGFGIIVTAASVNTILQTIVDDDKRGASDELLHHVIPGRGAARRAGCRRTGNADRRTVHAAGWRHLLPGRSFRVPAPAAPLRARDSARLPAARHHQRIARGAALAVLALPDEGETKRAPLAPVGCNALFGRGQKLCFRPTVTPQTLAPRSVGKVAPPDALPAPATE